MTACANKIENDNVHQSKWGYHPCSYETFLKLKALHKAYWQAVRGLAEWFRWDAKQPQNRVIKERIKDGVGRVTGWKIIGPKPEPKYCPIFGTPSYRRDYQTIPEHLNDHGILAAYQQARMPKKFEEVTPLKISEEKINELFDQLNNWK